MLLCVATVVSAQYYRDAENVDMLHIRQPRTQCRTEIRLPGVDGFNAYTADLHTHTTYSDGRMQMEGRVLEAWVDGLDIMAVTEHIEYRRYEKEDLEYYAGYYGKMAKPEGSLVYVENGKKSQLKADLNLPVRHAQKVATRLGITIIPGAEITRTPESIGHFNALFTTDNNAIYDGDAEKAIRNAKAQGALVMHNHPGWRRKSLEMSDFEKRVYDAGLIDGVEIMNGSQFYPKVIDRAWKYNLFPAACTDIHYTTADSYGAFGSLRNLTIIFAKDKSLESLREALDAKRTIAYSYGVLVGREELVTKFVKASLEYRFLALDYKNRPTYQITNNSSLEYTFRANNGNLYLLPANSSIVITLSKGTSTVDVKFENVWLTTNKFLSFTLEEKK